MKPPEEILFDTLLKMAKTNADVALFMLKTKYPEIFRKYVEPKRRTAQKSEVKTKSSTLSRSKKKAKKK